MHLLKLYAPMDTYSPALEHERSAKLKRIKHLIAQEVVRFLLIQVDIKELRALSRSPFGLVNDQMRKAAWPMLLNLQREATFEPSRPYTRDE